MNINYFTLRFKDRSAEASFYSSTLYAAKLRIRLPVICLLLLNIIRFIMAIVDNRHQSVVSAVVLAVFSALVLLLAKIKKLKTAIGPFVMVLIYLT